jgi:diacylglycerol kinase (ATP)
MRAAAILGLGNVATCLRRFQQIESVEWTDSPDHADAAVIFGGDGTVHRHLSTLVSSQLPVLVVPCGSGNDFARALGLGRVRDSLDAWRKFVAERNNVRAIDVGVIHESSADHYFCCIAGVGLDTEVAKRANALPKWMRSHGGYFLCAPREFLRFTAFPMKVSCNGDESSRFEPTILAAIANAPAYGGGMRIAPQAKLDDGNLDVCIVRGMETFKLFCLFPTVYFGRHLRFEEVEYTQTPVVRIDTESPLDVYADGEYVCQTPAEFSVARNTLKVIVP